MMKTISDDADVVQSAIEKILPGIRQSIYMSLNDLGKQVNRIEIDQSGARLAVYVFLDETKPRKTKDGSFEHVHIQFTLELGRMVE